MTCPDEADLIAYATGQMEGSSIAAVAAHLRQCRTCRKRVHEEMRNESILIRIRGGQDDPRTARPFETPHDKWSDKTPDKSDSATIPVVDPLTQLEECLGDRYKILEKVGAGGAGEVYRAYDSLLHRPVAVKVLFRSIEGGGSDDDFMNEARALARMNHPGIVQIHEIQSAAGRPCLVMEWVDGLPITHALHEATIETKVSVFARMIEAVSWAHLHGLLHRDLKPSNILVTPDGQVKVVDFHLALRTEAVHPNEFRYYGTPSYSAPEQFIPGKQIGPATDVFSLGVIMYEVLTGQHPFLGHGSAKVVESILGNHPERPAIFVPDLPAGLENICLKALEKDPALRYPDAHALAIDLQRYTRGEVVWARPSYVADQLQSEITQHLQRLQVWSNSGFVTQRELDRLQQVYDQVLTPKEVSILDTRRMVFSQVCLYLGAWVVAIAASLLVLFEWAHISSTVRPLPAIAAWLAVTIPGAWLWRKGDWRLATGCFVASNLLTPMIVLGALYHWNLLTTRQPADYEAFVSYSAAFSNYRLIAAGFAWLASSLILLQVTRSSVTTLLSCVSALVSLTGLYLAGGMMTWQPDNIAGRYIWPAIALVAIGIVCDRRKLTQYAWPCATIGTLGLAWVLSAIAVTPNTFFGWIGLKPAETTLSHDECVGLSYVIAGLIFLAVAGIYRTVGTRLHRRLAEALNWIGSLCVLLPLRFLDSGRFEKSLVGQLRLYEKALPIASLAFIFGSVPRQMKSFFFAGLIGLGISIQRLTVRHFSDDFRWPVGLIAAGLTFMLLAWLCPTLLAARYRKD